MMDLSMTVFLDGTQSATDNVVLLCYAKRDFERPDKANGASPAQSALG
jgi:hypothetical protein